MARQPTFDPDRRPEWRVERVEQKLGLTCPYCGGKMLVSRKKWIQGAIPRHYEYQDIFARLRACCYCTQLARIPVAYKRK